MREVIIMAMKNGTFNIRKGERGVQFYNEDESAVVNIDFEKFFSSESSTPGDMEESKYKGDMTQRQKSMLKWMKRNLTDEAMAEVDELFNSEVTGKKWAQNQKDWFRDDEFTPAEKKVKALGEFAVDDGQFWGVYKNKNLIVTTPTERKMSHNPKVNKYIRIIGGLRFTSVEAIAISTFMSDVMSVDDFRIRVQNVDFLRDSFTRAMKFYSGKVDTLYISLATTGFTTVLRIKAAGSPFISYIVGA